MSNNIDNRVVNMQFNNGQFENGIKTSTKSLENLKKGLDLDKSTRNLSELQRASGKFSMGNMGSSIDLIASRFTALGIVGTTVLQNLTNSAMAAGKSFISSLTLDPITAGFSEYEIKMNSIKTILANTKDKGTTLDDVNKALAELNEYADKTVYNFAEMTDMVGKFAAKTGELKSSVNVVKGLANLAARSGVDNTRLQGALYQVSQISETVKSLDWMSIDTAGLGTVKFKNDLIAMAKAMGTIDLKTLKDLESGTVSFRETLSKDWLTKGVFNAVTSMYAMDEGMTKAAGEITTFTKLLTVMKESVASGWAVTWEHIIGNKDESTALFTTIGNAFANLSSESADARNSMLEFWSANGGRQAVLEGIGNILVSIGNLLEPIEKAFSKLFPPMTGETLVWLSKGFRDLTATFKIGEITMENLRKTFSGVFAIVDVLRQAFLFVVDVFGLVLKALAPVGDGFLFVVGKIGEFLVYVNRLITENQVFAKMLGAISGALEYLRSAISSVTIESESFTKAMTFIKGVLSNLVENIKNAIEVIKNMFSGVQDSAFDGVTNSANVLNSSFDTLTATGTKLRNSFTWLGDVFNKTVAPAFAKAGSVLKATFGPAIEELLSNISKLSLADIGSVLAGGGVALTGGGIFLMIKKLREVFGSVGDVADSFNAVLGGVTGTLETFQTKLKADALFKIALSIAVLAGSIVALSLIKDEDMTRAMVAIVTLLGALTGALVLLQKSQFAMTGLVGGLISIGVAVMLLTISLKKLSDIDRDKMLQGVEGLSALLTVLALFIKVTGTGGIQASMVGMIGLSTGLLLMTFAIERFSNMDPNKVQQGISGIAASLGMLAIFIKLVNPAQMISIGVGMVALGASLYLVAGAIAIFGTINPKTLTVGIIALAGALGVMAIAVRAMTGALSGAAAMLVMALAINTLVPAIVILGNLDIKTIGIALLALAGVFVVLGLAGLALTPLAPIIMTLAASVGVLGLGVYLLGGGLVLFAAGVAAFAGAGGLLLKTLGDILMGIINLIPVAAKKLGEGLIAFLKAIEDGIPAIVSLLKKLCEGVIKVLVDMVPPLVDALLKVLAQIMKSIDGALPEILKLGFSILITLLKGIRDNIKEVVILAIDIILEFVRGINERLGDIVKVAADFIVALVDGLEKEMDRIVDAAFRLVMSFIEAVVNALIKYTPMVLKSIGDIATAILKGLGDGLQGGINAIGKMGEDVIKGFLNGIKNKFGEVVDAGKNLGSDLLNATKKALGIASPSKFFKEIGNNLGKGLTIGVQESSKPAEVAATTMSNKVAKASTGAVKKSSKANAKVIKKSNEDAKKAFDKSVEWIDERKYYNQLSLQQELAAWQAIQKRYKEGTEERKKADREVYRVKNEIVKDSYQHSMDWIDKEKYYNRLALEEELAAFKRVQARYKEGTEERKKADGEIYRIEKEINQTNEDYQKRLMEIQQDVYDKRIDMEDEYYQKTKDVNDQLKQDIKSLTDEYEKALESRADALYSAYGLFDKVNRPQEDAKKKVSELKEELAAAERLQLQYKVGSEKRKQADQEAARIRKELIDAEDQVISGSSLIRNLQSQVKTFELWKDNIQVLAVRGVDQELIKELEGMGPKAIDEIQAINTMSKPELDKYVTLWREKHQLAKEQAGIELEDMRLDTINQISELEKAASDELDKYRKTWVEKMVQLSMEASKELTLLEREWLEKIGTIRSDTEKEFDSMVKNSIGYIESRNWSTLGTEVVSGLVKGIKSQSMMLTGEIADAARGMLETMKKELGIQSPSVEFAKIGMFAVTGLVNGLKNNAKMAMAAGSELGQSTKESLRNTFLKMGELLTSEDMSPTIRPVLDMSNVENSLASTFGKTQGISVSATASKASSVSTTASKTNGTSDPVTNQTNNTDNAKIEINNSYVVRNDNDIRKISSDLKNTLIKYNKAKGVVLA